MKCPKCNTSLDIDAKVCFACGEEITEEFRRKSMDRKDKEFDEVIQNLMMTEGLMQEEEESETKLFHHIEKEKKKEAEMLKYRYVSYITLAVIFLFFISLFLNWYSISGTAAFHGYFYTEKTASYISPSAKAYSNDKLIDRTNEVARFSPNKLLAYAKEYQENSDIHGLLAKLQIYYVKSLYLIYLLSIACGVALIFDKKSKMAELIRLSSIFAFVFILLNTLAMKLPYINLIVLNAKKVLGMKGVSSRIVSTGLYLYESTKQNLSYQVSFQFGWFLAVICIAIWFILATVLMEISRLLKDTDM